MNMSIRFPHLGIDLGYVGKTVSVFGFEITLYGILIAAGMLLGLSFIILQAKRENQDQNLYLEALIPGVLIGMVCARLSYVAMHWKLFEREEIRALWDIRTGGMTFYGGLLGGVIVTAIFCKGKKISFGRMADTISLGLVLSQMIGVWGNFFSREFLGEYTDSFLAMQIPADVLTDNSLTAKIQKHLTTVGDISYAQVHPLFLYESLWCLFMFFVLLLYSKRKKFQGEIFMRYLSLYGLGRIGIEWLCADKICIPGTEISVFLPVSAGLFVLFGIVAEVRRIMSKKREKVRRSRKEKYRMAEEKASRSYGNMQSFEDVSAEFKDVFSASADSQVEKTAEGLKESEILPKTISDKKEIEEEIK